jgi:hypothetical protein
MASKERLIERWKNFKQPELEKLKCYICDYEENISNYKIYKVNDIFEAGELIRYECPCCTVIFGDMRFLLLDQSEIDNDYSDLYSFYNEGDTTEYIIKTLSSIDIFNDKSKSYLDYACGNWNNIVPYLRENGYNIYGYDKYVNSDNYFLNDITGLKFDVIYNNNFIEHLINPIDFISTMVNHLNDYGYIIFISPCFEYSYDFTHYHTFFFNDKSLEYISKKINIKLIDSKRINFNETGTDYTVVKVFQKY